jgi:hypothetical protein
MPRGKDQKTIAKRIDLHYWRKPHRLRTARRALVLGCLVVAVGWIAYASTRQDGGESLYNPGHVTGGHAMIENNCAACHEPDEGRPGQFVKAVSDAACMKCHEAPTHAPTQLVRDGDNSGNPLVLARWLKQNGLTAAAAAAPTPPAGEEAASQPADAHHGGTLVSAQCAACHVEHRGREALAAVSDMHCTQCHSDLSKAVAAGTQSQVPAKVVAFNKNDHPAFGRRLPKDEQGNWVDPTKLKFNHKVHIVDQKLNDCAMCHTTRQPNLTRTRPGHDPAKPPYATGSDRLAAWANASDGRYMQPVNFEQHCQQCHPIKVSGVKGTFAHDDIAVVRSQVYAAFQESAATRYEKPPGGEASGGGGGRRRGSKKDEGPADEGEWLKGELEKLNKNIVAVQKTCAKCHDMADQKSDIASLTPATERDLRAFLGAVAAADGMMPAAWDGARADVHLAMQRRPRPKPAGAAAPTPPADEAAEQPADAPAAAKPAAKPKPRKPIKAPALQTTEPTGIPGAPRRWFAASRFDHRSHRDMACVECHSKLDNLDKIDGIQDETLKADLTFAATDTRAVLSPGMEWSVPQFAAASEGQWTVSSSRTRSCMECHQPDTAEQRFATAACVTCHAYHDHSKEIYPDGRPEPRVTTAENLAAPAPAPSETPAETRVEPEETTEAAPSEEGVPPADTSAPAEGEAPALAAEPAPEAAPETPSDAAEAPVEAAPADTPAEAMPAEAEPAEAAPAEAAPVDAESAPEAEPEPRPVPTRRARRPRTSPGG